MESIKSDLNRQLMLDANAVSGLLGEIFAADVTASLSSCAHCGNVAEVGTLLAFTLGPGIILRCSVCEKEMLRIAKTPQGIYLDARGTALLHLKGDSGSGR